MKVRWLTGALRSLRLVQRYVALDDPEAAQRTGEHIWRAVRHLAKRPRLGRPGAIAETRDLIIGGLPYVIVYRLAKAEVQVLRVFHAKPRLY